MAGKRNKRRNSKSRSRRPSLTPEQLQAAAEKSLANGQFRDAIGHFKSLLKIDGSSQWRKGLEAAYRGRALELTAKGMLNEALVIWENCRVLTPGAPMVCEHITLLCEMSRVSDAGVGYREALETLDPNEIAQLRSNFAVLYLIEPRALDGQLPPDDPVILQGAYASSALDAYCSGDDQAVERALENIPFRSPYRDWAQILKGILKLPDEPGKAQQLLNRIPPDSPFSRLQHAIQSALEPEPEFITRLAELDDASRRFAAALRGWPEQRLRLWGQIHALGDPPKPEMISKWLFSHRELLGEDWVRKRALRLMIGSRNCFPKEARLTPLERDMVIAWRSEEGGDPWDVFGVWKDVIDRLKQSADEPGSDNALRIALIQRRLDSRWQLLDDTGMSFDFDDIAGEILAGLEESLRLDPDDQPTYRRLIGWYRERHMLKDARRLLDLALARLPEDLEILIQALETAVAGNAYKKAAGFARRILNLDPVNARAKNSLLEAHLAHARKQIRKGRSDLTQKELNSAEEWARDTKAKARLDLLRGLLLLDENPDKGAALLVAATEHLGGGITGRLDLALEIQLLDRSPGIVIKKLGLSQIKCPEKTDLLAFLRQLREQLDHKREIPHAVLDYFTPPLKASSRLKLTQQESEAVCETLRRCRLDKVRLAHARTALKRWRGMPVFELHAFEAKYEGVLWSASEAELERLATALEKARTAGDRRTAMRIEEALQESTPFQPHSPHGPLGSPDTFFDMIDEMGIEGFFDLLNRTGMLPPELKALEREMGSDTLLAFLDGLREGESAEPTDAPFDLPEPPRPKREKKRSGQKPSTDEKREESPEQPPSKQLNLFE